MTQPVPEETNEAFDLETPPDDEHPSEAPDGDDGSAAGEAVQEENAGTSLDQPSS